MDPIEQAIQDCLPEDEGKRAAKIFELARRLKAFPHMAGAEVFDLKAAVERWHYLARPFIDSKEFLATWSLFSQGWVQVKFPVGQGPLDALVETARRNGPPPEATGWGERSELLAALCRELQHAAGDAPFFLGCRTAGQVLGVGHGAAARYLRGLVAIGLLQVVARGSQATKKATRYRYLGSDL